MHIIPRIDLMVAYTCNISCRGCISLSDFPRKGVAPISDIEQWCSEWSTVICPDVITIFGGEPLIHPKLLDVFRAIRLNWPSSTIRLITNGYLLDKYDPMVWFDFGPVEVQVSIHRQDHVQLINQHIKKILLCHSDWTVQTSNDPTEHKQIQWTRPDFKIYKSMFGEFVAPYKSTDGKLTSNFSKPELAHSICGSPDSPVLYKGQLYKCAAVANAIDYTKENWHDYRPLSYTSDLTSFINCINKPEPVCSQCPAKEQATIYNHLDTKNVVINQQSILKSC